MCRGALLAALLVLVVGPRPVSGQSASFQTRQARAIALRDSLRAAEAAARQRGLQAAVRGRNGPVLVVLRASDGQFVANAVAEKIWQAYRDFGVFTDSTFLHIALVDDAIGNRGDIVDGRRAVAFGRPGGLDRMSFYGGGSAADALADNAIWTVSDGLMGDSLANAWMERHFDPRDSRDVTFGVLQELAAGQWHASRGCLEGAPGECAVYLGIESPPDFEQRFPVEDIRNVLARTRAATQRGTPQRRCLDGDDDVCREIYRAYVAPSGLGARRSFLVFIRMRYGVEAARALLLGPEPILGERVRRGTGQPPEVVAAQWREWLLGTERREPVSAGFRELVAALATAGVMIVLATRSGRWLA